LGPDSPSGGIEVKIDTSAAGFTDIPCYFAWLPGSPWDQDFATFQHIDEPTIGSFIFRMWSQPPMGYPHALLRAVWERKIYVYWLGIQPWHQDDNQSEAN
jgi:hypothetical protein